MLQCLVLKFLVMSQNFSLSLSIVHGNSSATPYNVSCTDTPVATEKSKSIQAFIFQQQIYPKVQGYHSSKNKKNVTCIYCYRIPSLKLTTRPWKWAETQEESNLPSINFQGCVNPPRWRVALTPFAWRESDSNVNKFWSERYTSYTNPVYDISFSIFI